jgi:hypothetical protein
MRVPLQPLLKLPHTLRKLRQLGVLRPWGSKLCHAVESADLQRDRVYEPYARLEGVLSRCPFPDVRPL